MHCFPTLCLVLSLVLSVQSNRQRRNALINSYQIFLQNLFRTTTRRTISGDDDFVLEQQGQKLDKTEGTAYANATSHLQKRLSYTLQAMESFDTLNLNRNHICFKDI